MAVTDSVSFKAYLKRDGLMDEVRRFGIEGGAATNFVYLRGKIQAMFPSLRNDNFLVFWKDQEGDLVAINSDEELVVALTENGQTLNKIYITEPGPKLAPEGQIHVNITCDGCQKKSIEGYRYKCLNCRDYDLCAVCEAKGLHSEHFMLRLPYPTSLGHHFGRRFSRSPHRGHKEGKGHKYGREPRFGCPFGPEQAWANRSPFDWSALGSYLSNFIPSVNLNENMANTSSSAGNAQASSFAPNEQSGSVPGNPCAGFTCGEQQGYVPGEPSTGSASKEFTAGTASNAQTSNNQSQEDLHVKYLRTVGETIAAFLDPMGIDVSFDVQQKQRDAKQSAKPEPTASTSQPMPSTSQNTPTQGVQIPITIADLPNVQSPPTTVTEPLPTQTHSRKPSFEGWTMLNRESHSRSPSQPMDVEECRGAIPKQTVPAATTPISSATPTPSESGSASAPHIYPTLPPQTAPPTPQDTLRQGIQDALEKIVSMGFDMDAGRLQTLLQNQNGDITKVVDFLLK